MKPAFDFHLDNGMKFIVAENPAATAVAVSFWARVGVCDEAPGLRGLAHFMEHMMFRGSENVPPEGHSRTLAQLGGECNAYTSADGTVYHETLPPTGLETAFRLEADRFLRLRLREDLLAVEKNVVFEEFRHLENQPLSRAWRLLMEKLLGHHPYATDPLGRREDLAAMALEDLSSFYRRLYRPDRVFGVLSGHLDGSRVRDLAAKYFGEWKGSPIQNATPPPELSLVPGSRVEKLSVEVPLALSLCLLKAAAREDGPALKVLQAYLGRGESCPLKEDLIKKKKLCVDAGGMMMIQARGGLFGLYGSFLDGKKGSRVQGALEDFRARTLKAKLDRNRLRAILKRFRRDRAYDGYSASRRMEGLGEAELNGGGYQRYERELEDLGAVDEDRIRGLMERFLSPDRDLRVLLLPEAA